MYLAVYREICAKAMRHRKHMSICTNPFEIPALGSVLRMLWGIYRHIFNHIL